MFTLGSVLVLSSLSAASGPAPPPGAVRMIDLDGDGMLDRIELGAGGGISLSMNRGARQFEPIVQDLPAVVISDVLVDDLNGDGREDLYLVSPRANLALLGDGTGRFVDATVELGLADGAEGLRAERLDLDGDGMADVLLHNRSGDVIFWGADGGVFERDPSTPRNDAAPHDVRGDAMLSGADGRMAGVDSLVPPAASGGVSTAAARGGARRGVAAERSRDTRAGAPSGGRVAAGASGAAVPPSSPASTGASAPATLSPPCAMTVADESGGCVTADSTPTLGRLYPLGPELNIQPSGSVGVGTLAPLGDLHVANSLVSELRISPDTGTFNAGGADLFLSEVVDSNCGWRISYDGVAGNNPLKISSECSSPTTRMAIERGGLGSVIVGGEDFSDAAAGSGRLRVVGDASQSLTGDGLVKAAVHVDGIGTASITRSFNNLPGGATPSLTDLGPGIYEVDFGADVSGRFYMGTIGGGVASNAPNRTIEVTPRAGIPNALFIETRDLSDTQADTEFYLVIL